MNFLQRAPVKGWGAGEIHGFLNLPVINYVFIHADATLSAGKKAPGDEGYKHFYVGFVLLVLTATGSADVCAMVIPFAGFHP